MDSIRCVGCGKVIETGSKSVRVANGKLEEGAFAETKEWGVMHEDCFDQSVESPASALAKIRKLAKATTVAAKKVKTA